MSWWSQNAQRSSIQTPPLYANEDEVWTFYFTLFSIVFNCRLQPFVPLNNKVCSDIFVKVERSTCSYSWINSYKRCILKWYAFWTVYLDNACSSVKTVSENRWNFIILKTLLLWKPNIKLSSNQVLSSQILLLLLLTLPLLLLLLILLCFTTVAAHST